MTMNPGCIAPKGQTPRGWTTVLEDVAHPNHEGVKGALCYHPETRAYQLLEWNEVGQNYVAYAVPHAWAVGLDPANAPTPLGTCATCGFIGVTVVENRCGGCTRAALLADSVAKITEALG